MWRVVLGPGDLPEFRNRKGAPKKRQLPTKNQYFTIATRGKGEKRFNQIVSRVDIRNGLANAIADVWWAESGRKPPMLTTPVTLRLVQYAPRIRRSGVAKGLPLLDSDACLSAVRDALQHSGFIANDALIACDTSEARYRKGEPGLEIELRPM